MSNTTAKYSAGEIGRVGLVEDFLPPPADLVPREGNVKVTLSLSDPSPDLVRAMACKSSSPRMRGEV